MKFQLTTILYSFKRATFCFLFISMVGWLGAQCPAHVTITIQQDIIDLFNNYPSCTHITGNLTIENSNSLDISALSSITDIDGALSLSNNSNLLNVNTLSSLNSIGTEILIIDNDGLSSIDLSGVSAPSMLKINVRDNEDLVTALLPTNVQTVSGHIQYYNNPLLEEISSMDDLVSIGTFLNISNTVIDPPTNPMPSFNSLISIGTSLSSGHGFNFNYNANMQSLPDMPVLADITGSVRIEYNPKLTSFNLSGVSAPDIYNVNIRDNNTLVTALLPTDVQTISGYLQYHNNPLLEEISSMNDLVSIATFLNISNTVIDPPTNPMPSFNSLISIGTSLSSGHGFNFNYNANLKSLPDMPVLADISGVIRIEYNPKLTSFDLSGVSAPSLSLHNVNIRDNNVLVTALIPTDVQTISGYLQYHNNPLLEEISSMNDLVSIATFLNISNTVINPPTNPMPSFNSLISIGTSLSSGHGFNFNYNATLKSLPDMPVLADISGVIRIEYNPKLTSFDLSGASAPDLYNVNIRDNNGLVTALLPTDVATVTGYLQYHNNPLLEEISEMPSLVSVGQYLSINTTLICQFPNFPSLSSIGTGFYIRDNVNALALPTCSNSTTIGGIIHIIDNPSLSYCSVQTVCDYLQTNGTRVISNNLGDCLNEVAVTAACNTNLSYPTADLDGDGFSSCDGDCDETDATIFPGATELCDGLDNDCDGLIDYDDPDYVDIVIPTAVCKPPFSVALDLNGEATITPNMVENGSSDDCTQYPDLTFSVSPNMFDCSTIGDQTVTLTVTDLGTNPNTCSTTITVLGPVYINSINVTHEACAGQSDGTITIDAGSTAGGQIGYSIDGGASFSFSNIFTNLSTGTYNIVVKLFGGNPQCSTISVTGTATINPGAPAPTWYKDIDGDGYTDGITQVSCTQPTGYVSSAPPGDCNDYDANQFPGQTWYKDADDDDYTDGNTQTACSRPPGYKLSIELVNITDIDCDDNNPDINHAATEVCNGIDDNCNGQIDEGLSNETHHGNVHFSSQQQIDAWPNCFSIMKGHITISGSDITDLGPLSNITEIKGGLNIMYNSSLNSLEGLEGITSIKGSLKVFYNFSLNDCCAIHDLINGGVTGAIMIFFNATNCNSTAEINSNCGGGNLASKPKSETTEGEQLKLIQKSQSIHAGQKLTLFPNPATDQVSLKVEGMEGQCGFLTITDNIGRVVYELEVNDLTSTDVEVNTADFPNGLYNLTLQAEGLPALSKRFVKVGN